MTPDRADWHATELYDSPKNLFVAGFIGSPAMNFLKGQAKSNGTIEVEGSHLSVAGAHQVSDGHGGLWHPAGASRARQ